ncbi:MAG: hypothetical protein HGA46_11570 [Chlorobiaceae bacterium]|nr:hypothetical protein [Chlorobiaceae bacterium]
MNLSSKGKIMGKMGEYSGREVGSLMQKAQGMRVDGQVYRKTGISGIRLFVVA